ncbi:MAG TPA: efflux RND transporter permease subunit [Bacteroidales bacterium]|nr:efflux RND transporter permease subunit [Bacteroidales bacterium]
MVDFLVKRPVATIMSFIAFVVLGLISTQRIPVSLLPDINIPEITVYVSKENTSLHELETSVVTPFRKQLLQVPGVKDIKSETRNNQSFIRLIFEYGVDIDYAFIEVNDKIDAIMAYMPKEVSRPRIIKASATDIPVFYLNISYKLKELSSESFLQLSDFVNNVIKKRIEQLPEVALADVTGTADPEIFIIPKQEKIRSLGITLEDIRQAFVANNLNPGSILVQDGHYQYNIMFNNQLKNMDDIRNIYINKNNRVFQLKDIANIGIRPKERTGMFLSNGNESVSLAIIKHSSAQMNSMKNEVNEVIRTFEKDFPELNFEISQDQTLLLNYSINNLKQSLILGCILAIVVMFLFIRNPRAPLLIAFSIPVSLIVSMFIFHMAGISINIISLSGLILGVGMMIDNSIIVIDNISQFMQRGDSLLKGIVQGVNEVIRPLISSVLTTCAVFIPLVFLSGISGALFYDQAMAVTIGLFVSLVVSITLLPVLYKLFNVNLEKKDGLHFVLFDLEKHYNSWFDKTFRYRKIIFPMFFIFILMGVVVYGRLEKRQMPHIDQQEMFVKIDWNQNISITQSKERLSGILNVFGTIQQSDAYLGVQRFLLNKSMDLGLNESLVYIQAGNSNEIEHIKENIKEIIIEEYPAARVEFYPPKNVFQRIFSGSSDALLVAEISTSSGQLLPGLNQLDAFTRDIQHYTGVDEVPKVPLQEYLSITLDQQKMLLYQVDQQNILVQLKNAFSQNEIGRIVSQNSFIPVITTDKKESVNKLLGNTFVQNKSGAKIPILSLITTQKRQDYKTILSNEAGAYIPLVIDIESGDVNRNIQQINDIATQNPELQVSFSGAWFENKKLIKEMSIVLFISLLLLYFILAAQFESLIQPLIVLIEVPIDIAGAFLFLYLFGSSINLLSLIGIVVMTGIIINDSILKIDTINKLRQEGYGLLEAIHLGGTRRLKPIIMTSLTTILALVPFLFGHDMGSELQYPLAIAIMGGLFVGTIVSLFFIPLVYYFLYKNRLKV